MHHCFVEVDGDIMAVDEWDSAESFQAFFEGNEDIPKIIAETGAQGPPEISVRRVLDTPDIF